MNDGWKLPIPCQLVDSNEPNLTRTEDNDILRNCDFDMILQEHGITNRAMQHIYRNSDQQEALSGVGIHF